MGRLFLVARLARRDLRRHPIEGGLFLLAIAAATTTLALGLVLHGVTDRPYWQTRTATAGPDVVASFLNLPTLRPGRGPHAGLTELAMLRHAAGVVAHDGPYPIAWPTLRTRGLQAPALAEGRDPGAAPIDQPKVTEGRWIHPDEIVVERAFATALSLHAGDLVTLNGRPFRVAGVAVTAADSPYPKAGYTTYGSPNTLTGRIWLTRSDARSLATHTLPLSYTENLKLAHPSQAQAFANGRAASTAALGLSAWQQIRQLDGNTQRNERRVLVTGSWLLALLGIASVAVLVGGRMAEQMRRVGLLKAVGASARLIASVLVVEHLFLALLAAALGLLAGSLVAPLFARSGSGLIGSAIVPSLSIVDITLVAAVALTVALTATLMPAIRAARTSTISALVNPARQPRRHPLLNELSAQLPVPLLLGLRLVARRPWRAALSGASIAITATTLVATVTVHARLAGRDHIATSTLADPRTAAIDHVLAAITVVLVVLAVVNAIFITWTTALDARQPLALARALGATSTQLSAGIAAAQLLPAIPSTILGIPAGIALVDAVSGKGFATTPSAASLVAVVLGTLLALATLTALPARFGARRPVAEILQSELT